MPSQANTQANAHQCHECGAVHGNVRRDDDNAWRCETCYARPYRQGFGLGLDRYASLPADTRSPIVKAHFALIDAAQRETETDERTEARLEAEADFDLLRAEDDGMVEHARPAIIGRITALALVLGAICATLAPTAGAVQRYIPAHATRFVPGCKHGEPVGTDIAVAAPYTLTRLAMNGHAWVATEGKLTGRVVASTRGDDGGLLVRAAQYAVDAEIICR